MLALAPAGCRQGGELKVMSLNIRYDNQRDGINAWPGRSEFAAAYLKQQQPDLLGLQEVLWHQYEYLQQMLTGYSSVAAGRDDGLMSGEACPVFYRSDRFELIEHNTFWLSGTPGVAGSLGPGAVLPRIATWVHLREMSTGRTLHFFNTHFCHVSDSARIMSSMILRDAVREIAGDGFFVVTGDFNLTPGSRAYAILTGEGTPLGLLSDSYGMSGIQPAGPAGTFNGFSDKPSENRIDYIFLPAGTMVLWHETEMVKSGEIFISDHWPVKALVSW